MNSLSATLAGAKAEGRSALVGYLPAGFPSEQESIELIHAMVAGGVDIVEVGLPYSDPLMDGPVIESAVAHSLAAGTNTETVMRVVAGAASSGAPILVMSYWNPIDKYGEHRFASALRDAGGVGVIAPDLTPEESSGWIQATDKHGIDRIYLVAPSSSAERLKIVTDVTSGFVYAASTMGVTGVRNSVSDHSRLLVEKTRQVTDLPICVGLGVSNADQAAEIAQYADGVIVGSAFVRAISEAASHEEALDSVKGLASRLAEGVRRSN